MIPVRLLSREIVNVDIVDIIVVRHALKRHFGLPYQTNNIFGQH